MSQEFIDLREAHRRRAVQDWVDKYGYKPELKHRLPRPTKKQVAIVVCVINTPLPTCSLVTNPIIYRKITKTDFGKLGRKLRLFFA